MTNNTITMENTINLNAMNVEQLQVIMNELYRQAMNCKENENVERNRLFDSFYKVQSVAMAKALNRDSKKLGKKAKEIEKDSKKTERKNAIALKRKMYDTTHIYFRTYYEIKNKNGVKKAMKGIVKENAIVITNYTSDGIIIITSDYNGKPFISLETKAHIGQGGTYSIKRQILDKIKDTVIDNINTNYCDSTFNELLEIAIASNDFKEKKMTDYLENRITSCVARSSVYGKPRK